MTATASRLLKILRERRSRQPAILLVLLVLLLLVQLAEWNLASGDRETDPRDRERQAQEALTIAVREFSGIQRSARRIAVDAGQRAEVLRYLSGTGNDRAQLFGVAAHIADQYSVGVEVFDAQAELVTWAGPGGPNARQEVRIALDGQMTSSVLRTPVFSQLFVATPVRSAGRILGVVVIRQTLETRYPFSNRYIDRSGLAERLSGELGVQVEYDFTQHPDRFHPPGWRTAPLIGIDSARLGDVHVLAPDWDLARERLSGVLASVHIVLLAFLAAALMVPLTFWLFRRISPLLAGMGVTAGIWAFRYFILWIGFPSQLTGAGIFDPALFSALFGDGLARSIGEMTLTVAALSVNVYVILLLSSRGTAAWPWLNNVRSLPLRVGMTAGFALLMFGLLRGTGAVVRSAAFDSTLNIGDPGVIFPSFALTFLLLNLLVLCLWWLVLALRGTDGLVRLFGGAVSGWVVIAVLYLAAALLFGVFQDEPLMSMSYRLAVAVCIPGIVWIRRRRGVSGLWPRTIVGWILTAALGTIVLLPILGAQVNARDRSRVETYAAEVLRPVDDWLKFIVEEGLTRLSQPEVKSVLAMPDVDSRGSAALAGWARSAACREGYTSVFEVVDTAGNGISRFAIGTQTGLASQVAETLPLDSVGGLRVKSIGDGVSAVRIYGGSLPLKDSSGMIVAYGRVVVAAGEQLLFRGDAPPVLRGSAREPLESFYRPISLSEYRDGLLLRSTNEALPFNHTLSDSIRATLLRSSPPMVWIAERINGIPYESFYVQRGQDGRDVIVLSMQRHSVVSGFVGLVKVPVVYGVLLLFGLILYLAMMMIRGQRYIPTFRDQLLGAMLLTALVPLGLLLVYSQYEVRNRVMESTARRLEAETATIALDIAGIGEHADASSEFSLRPERVELIASNAGTDFNVYVDNELRISSRPELYAAGLLDTRMNGSAFAAVTLSGLRFHMQTENIGLFRYVVGYRPVLDNAGGIIGVVSVPTLYRQDELERELYDRNAVLFGIYAVVLTLVLVMTTLLANRIAAPLQRLTALTRDVAAGDLQIAARLPRAEGEIGDLVHAFENMILDLRASRDNLVQAERELAWKEMARQVAHEIKNPLTPMRLSIQHLRQTYRDRAPDFGEILDQVTRTVIEQIDTLSRIASEFSSFARMPRRILEACDVREVVTAAVQLFEQDDRVIFEVTTDDDLPSLSADKEELRRAFINIIRNGVQAMNGAGRMVIIVKRGTGMVRISFRDTGAGIPDELKSRLFQPNFSTKTDGMGLGLAIVKKTVDDLGGSVRIESEIGKGTTVVMNLPLPESTQSSS